MGEHATVGLRCYRAGERLISGSPTETLARPGFSGCTLLLLTPILALIGWKAAVILHALRTRPVLDSSRPAFLVMTALFLFVLGSGFTWAYAGRILFGRVALIELHMIGAAVLAGWPAWHAVARSWVWRLPPSRDRRALLRLGAGAATGVILWQGGEALANLAGFPGAKRRFTGWYETGSHTGSFPVVSWLTDDPDRVDVDGWRLVLDGHLENARELSHADLSALGQEVREVTLDCTGGWYTTQQWSGVPVPRLVDPARPEDGVESIEVVSVTG
ncbi:MAG: molybdopterin-dependent oxidoreductase [Dehalococcoidia bacterium]|nr:molybdopterin-dependent oxidoreductase [Dehalococcoidia bacterium]